MAKNNTSTDINKMSFEGALEEMESIVQKLESGEVKLDEAIDAYTRGSQLKKHCENKLKEAQVRIDKIILGPNGEIETESVET
jgi:exodeoxyribonuclease VII small subunit|tara:strand:+ start:480 stop:728 length:249 start_codon:yes stop_codon:yes gene_type:complete